MSIESVSSGCIGFGRELHGAPSRHIGAGPAYSGMRTIVVTATSSPGLAGVEKFHAIFTP